MIISCLNNVVYILEIIIIFKIDKEMKRKKEIIIGGEYGEFFIC